MKKSTIIIFLALTILKTQAQDYLISFAGAGDTTVVSTVKVDNLKSGATVTLNGGDVLHLKPPLGIESQGMNYNYLKIQPNPMMDHAVLTFAAPDNGDAVFGIFDVSGKIVCQISVSVSQGENSFRISGINQGMYFVKVTGINYNYSAKLISQSNTKREAGIEYVSSVKNTTINPLKSSSTTIDMPYTTGDLLLYKGTTGPYGTIITDVPTSSKAITFNFVLCKDNDGNNYSTVQIGTQVWMAENLKTTKYRNDAPIPNVTDQVAWGNLTTGAYCNSNNDGNLWTTYGRLYNWFAVNDGRNISPTGWHVPTDNEWSILTSYLGGASYSYKLIETGTTHWLAPNTDATNETGFTGLPGGYRDSGGIFISIGVEADWWCSTEQGVDAAWARRIFNNSLSLGSLSTSKRNGYSVRCIQGSVGFVIGQNYGGGIIFYIDSTGQHGLISAASDQTAGAMWGCYGTFIGGTSTASGAGQANTTAIVNGCSEPGMAAGICNDLVLNGYSDWFLPSRDELNQMYLQKSVIGGFANGDYWSSSEYDATSAFGQNFGSGGQYMYYKYDVIYVRAVRSF
jgi:uncharacterized protein (TIGR02145 family)